jgi:hypothetical protein
LVEFTVAVKINDFAQGACTEFVSEEALAKLGKGPSCTWSLDNKTLNIMLGSGASIVNEPLKLIGTSLFTGESSCDVGPD